MLAWAVRRREEREAQRDIRMLRATLNVHVYAQDPKQFQDFGEIMEPLMPEWMKQETKKDLNEMRRKEAEKRLMRSLDEVERRLRRN